MPLLDKGAIGQGLGCCRGEKGERDPQGLDLPQGRVHAAAGSVHVLEAVVVGASLHPGPGRGVQEWDQTCHGSTRC